MSGRDPVAESTIFASGPVLGGALPAVAAPAVELALCAGTVTGSASPR